MQQPQQSFEFIESINDALGAAVRALGGAKKVGAMLKPAKPMDEAKNWVNDCLNANRDVFFHPEHVQFLLREAKQVGFHGSMNFVCSDAEYTAPQPIEPEDEKAQLMREFIEATKQQKINIEKLERMSSSGVNLRVAAG